MGRLRYNRNVALPLLHFVLFPEASFYNLTLFLEKLN